MLKQRLATAFVGLPLLVVLVIVGGPVYVAVVAIALAIAAGEFYHAAGLLRTPGAAIGVATVAGLAIAASAERGWPAGAVTAAITVPFLWPVLWARTETALYDWAIVAAGALYIGWLGAHAVLLRELDDGREWVLLAFGVVFATDTGAYFIGRAFGRRKMAPRVSPGKTWAGGVGGFACGAIVAAVLNFAFGLDAPPWEIAGLAIIVPVTAEIGDLAESVLKRSMHVKDMGKVMPGHGGIVDRLDSLLFAIPVLYYWVRWVIQ